MNNSIIINKLLDNIGFNKYQETDKQTHLFSYENLSETPRDTIFIYVLIVCIIFFGISHYKITLNVIVSIIVSYMLIYYILSRHKFINSQYNDATDLKLKFLESIMFDSNSTEINHLYRNPLIIQFFYNVRNYTTYNLSNYKDSLLHINNMIKLEYDMPLLVNPFDTYLNIKHLSQQAINSYQAIIHSVPYNIELFTKFNRSLQILRQLLEHIITKARKRCIETNSKSITTNTIPDSILANDMGIDADDTKTKEYLPNYDFY